MVMVLERPPSLAPAPAPPSLVAAPPDRCQRTDILVAPLPEVLALWERYDALPIQGVYVAAVARPDERARYCLLALAWVDWGGDPCDLRLPYAVRDIEGHLRTRLPYSHDQTSGIIRGFDGKLPAHAAREHLDAYLRGNQVRLALRLPRHPLALIAPPYTGEQVSV